MTFWSIVYVIGAAQAVLLALALWRRPVNAEGNRVLAGWIALIGLDLAIKALYFPMPGRRADTQAWGCAAPPPRSVTVEGTC
jgi:hypothetical protein